MSLLINIRAFLKSGEKWILDLSCHLIPILVERKRCASEKHCIVDVLFDLTKAESTATFSSVEQRLKAKNLESNMIVDEARDTPFMISCQDEEMTFLTVNKLRSEEHKSELKSLMHISYAVF